MAGRLAGDNERVFGYLLMRANFCHLPFHGPKSMRAFRATAREKDKKKDGSQLGSDDIKAEETLLLSRSPNFPATLQPLYLQLESRSTFLKSFLSRGEGERER